MPARLTRTQAIRANCRLCDSESSIEYLKCTNENCALHPYRLGKYHKGKAKAIRAYCKWCTGCDKEEYKTPVTKIKSCPSGGCPLYRYRMGREEVLE